jgi:hypothetical protein
VGLSARIKGAAIREVLVWYYGEHGADGVTAVLSVLPDEVRAQLDASDPTLGLKANLWYDARFVHAMLDAFVAPYPPAERGRMIHAATRAAVASSARGVYGVLIRGLVSPALYARHVQKLWRMLHDGGHREIVITAPGVARSRTWDWPGHHPILCEVTGQTIAALFEVMGEQNVVARKLRCISDGASECGYAVTWDA